MTIDLSGVHPAHLVPFEDDGERIDWTALRDHVAELDAIEGIQAMVTNGHGAEVFALTKDERVDVVAAVSDTVSNDTPVVSGLVAGSTSEAIEEGHRFRDAGADAFLLFPPHTGVSHRLAAAESYIESISEEVGIPIVLFQHPRWAGGTYDSETLAELASLDSVVAIKEASWDVDRTQKDVEALRENDVEAQFLVANDEHLLASYSLRADGSILILAAVVPELIVNLFAATAEGDLHRAREAYVALEPFVSMVYRPPLAESLPRLKKVLELQNRFPNAVPRKPALPVGDDEIGGIERAMERAEIYTINA